ncbi:DUF3919 family protein [Clostridium taeniosporum]|uniref:DUF3919 domain-containing protein n=1 Tax=Clostridium taeniosporum TaxID=394958 RepID=A0A1D7XII9_9CLOT|nr:DUF3919 family protein [Clostridium taeniosporum]AOR23158.1 DUF3919 domain-containing protein [Clostridium taeniosporum]
MKKISLKAKIIGIYTTIIIICIIMTSLNYRLLYNRVQIISDKDDVVNKINMSIPIKIEISNEKWGDYVFEDESSIQMIWNSISDIMNDFSEEENYITEGSNISIDANVYYLNGMKDKFKISDVLILNNHMYHDNNKLPLINRLKNDLLGYLYSTSNIANLINTRNRIVISDSNNYVKELNELDKESLKKIIINSTKLHSDDGIKALKKQNKKALSHIKIYIYDKDDTFIKVKSCNVVNIDVYDNGIFVVQYMGDENGQHTYFKGHLKDICENILGKNL